MRVTPAWAWFTDKLFFRTILVVQNILLKCDDIHNIFTSWLSRISNLGMFGISEFSAIINPPQCGILAVGGGILGLGEIPIL